MISGLFQTGKRLHRQRVGARLAAFPSADGGDSNSESLCQLGLGQAE